MIVETSDFHDTLIKCKKFGDWSILSMSDDHRKPTVKMSRKQIRWFQFGLQLASYCSSQDLFFKMDFKSNKLQPITIFNDTKRPSMRHENIYRFLHLLELKHIILPAHGNQTEDHCKYMEASQMSSIIILWVINSR